MRVSSPCLESVCDPPELACVCAAPGAGGSWWTLSPQSWSRPSWSSTWSSSSSPGRRGRRAASGMSLHPQSSWCHSEPGGEWTIITVRTKVSRKQLETIQKWGNIPLKCQVVVDKSVARTMLPSIGNCYQRWGGLGNISAALQISRQFWWNI